MDSLENKELLIALQEREQALRDKFDNLADAGDNISAKGVKKQLRVIRKLIVKIQNSKKLIFDGVTEKEEKKSDELDVYKQRDILLDLSYSILKELKDEKFDKNSSLGQDFIQQAENKINELEKIRDNDDR